MQNPPKAQKPEFLPPSRQARKGVDPQGSPINADRDICENLCSAVAEALAFSEFWRLNVRCFAAPQPWHLEIAVIGRARSPHRAEVQSSTRLVRDNEPYLSKRFVPVVCFCGLKPVSAITCKPRPGRVARIRG